MITVLTFFKRHWRKLALVAVVILAYGAGRFGQPTEVITKTEVVERVVEKVVERVVEKRVEVKAKAEVVYVDRVITKEGEVRERIVTKTVEREVAKAETTADKNLEKSTDTSAKAETITRNDAPRLSVLVLAGYQHNPSVQLIPGAGPLSVGAMATYRIVGPVTAGVGVMSTGLVFAAVGAQF